MFDDFQFVLKDNALKRKAALENGCPCLLQNDVDVIVIDPESELRTNETLFDASQSVNITNFKA